MRRWVLMLVAIVALVAAYVISRPATAPQRAEAPPSSSRPAGHPPVQSTGGEAGYDWADEKEHSYIISQNHCRSVRGKRPPPSDIPDAKTTASLKGCDSNALYYGFGVKADPVRARQCAFAEKSAGDNDWGSGQGLLITIYANGVGAKRDLDLAMHLACTLDHAAPAEYDGRVLHLAEMAKQASPKTFGYCDDVTSGAAGSACADHFARFDQNKRDAALAAMSSRWSPQGRKAFVGVRAALTAYVDAYAKTEQSMSGTMYGALITMNTEFVQEQFVALVQQLDSGRIAVRDAGAVRVADALLNRRYREMFGSEVRREYWHASDAELRDTQRKWLRYRDAFIAFAAVQYPGTSRDALLAMLSDQRSLVIGCGINEPGVNDKCPSMEGPG